MLSQFVNVQQTASMGGGGGGDGGIRILQIIMPYVYACLSEMKTTVSVEVVRVPHCTPIKSCP